MTCTSGETSAAPGVHSLSKVPKKSILKNDATERGSVGVLSDDTLQLSSRRHMGGGNLSGGSSLVSAMVPPPTRGVLKKDPSYDGGRGVVRARSVGAGSVGGRRESSSSGSSSEDVGKTFSDVVIDPIPGQGRRSAPEVNIFVFV